MTIDGTAFGSITIDGKTYRHDVVIRLSGKVVKRKKRLSEAAAAWLAKKLAACGSMPCRPRSMRGRPPVSRHPAAHPL